MKESKRLMRETKKKFILYSIIGIGLVMIVSYFGLSLHRQIVSEQSSIQTMYSIVNRQFNLVNKISLLSEKFHDPKSTEKLVDLESEYKSLLTELNQENVEFNKWLNENKLADNENIEGLLEREDVDTKMLAFMKKAKELVNNNSLTQNEIKKNVDYLKNSSRYGLGEVLLFAVKKLEAKQSLSLSMLNKMGFFLVSLCVLQVLLVWILVFRPLYSTISIQHHKITDAIFRAETANRSKTDFLANISHEIRTPMTTILGYSDLLKRHNLSDEEKDDAVKIIDQNASHLLSLIDEILDISKMESGKFDFIREEVSLSSFLNEVYSLIKVKAQEKNIDLVFKNKGKVPESIMADPKRLKQILFNILGNAIKFTSKGYVELLVSYTQETNKLSIKVKDTGRGISSSQRKKLFNPFEQGDSSLAREYGGTGLGLVLSKGLAQGMGGDVKILHSKLGHGTTVEIIVDVGSPENQKLMTSFSTNIIPEKSKEFHHSELVNTRILVVDDAKENARLFKLYLSEAGAKVDVANNGEKALELISVTPFDLVLLDLQMPGKDGFEIIKELRDREFERPVVALTAHAMPEDKDKTKAAGFDDHITKPVKPSELINSVSNLIQQRNIFTG